MYDFKPTSWDEVRPYDTITFNVEVNPERKPRLRRMVLTGLPYEYKDAYSVEHGMAALTGYHVTKSGERSKAYRSHRDDYISARIGLVVSVQRHGDAPADVAPVEPTPAPVKPLTPAMERAVETLERDGYVDTVDGYTVGTLVGLINRGIVRPALSLANGLSAGRHYPTTTPAQVWDDAHAMHLDECDRIARERDAREAEELEADGGWGQPDGISGTTEAARALAGTFGGTIKEPADVLSTVAPALVKVGDTVQRRGEEGPDCPVGKVTEVGHIGGVPAARVSFSGLPPIGVPVSGLVKVQTCPAGHVDPPLTDGGTCADCENLLPAPGADTAEQPIDLLRRLVRQSGGTVREISDALAALDQIKVRTPQRAVDTPNGAPSWLHTTCGWVTNTKPGPALTLCAGCKAHTDKWQAIHLPGGTR